MNPFREQLATRAEARFSVDRASMSMGDWICANTVLNERPFNFDRYPFQRQIASDMHPNLSCMKLSQVGLTEVQVRKILGFLVRYRGTTGIFTLPNQAMQKKLAQTRVKPLVEANSVFNAESPLQDTRSMYLYQFGPSFLHISDATEGSATSTPGDILFNDELDLTKSEMLGLFQSRLQNSDWKISQTFSTPTFKSHGIDQLNAVSDQHEYIIRCAACRRESVPTFTREFVVIPGLPDHIEKLEDIDDTLADVLDLHAGYVQCPKCGGRLDLGDHAARQWVPKYPTRIDARGYRVRVFSTDRLSIPYVISRLLYFKRFNALRRWHNTVLGDAYTGANEQLSIEDIRACMAMATPSVEDIDPDEPVFAGIDTGITCHLTLATRKGVFLMQTVPADKLVERVGEICDRYNLIAGAMDRHPQTTLANLVRARSENRIWPTEYRGTKALQAQKNLEGDITHWQCDRTTMLDGLASHVRGRTLPLGGYGHLGETVVLHLRNMVRDEQPEKPAVWLKLDGSGTEDHFFHSVGFLLLAMDIAEGVDIVSGAEMRRSIGVIGMKPLATSNMLTMRRGGRSAAHAGPLG